MPVVLSPTVIMIIPSEEDADNGADKSDDGSKHAGNNSDSAANQTKESAEQPTGNTDPDGERKDDNDC